MTLNHADREALVGMTKFLRTDDPDFVERMKWSAARRAVTEIPLSAPEPDIVKPADVPSPEQRALSAPQRRARWLVAALAVLAALVLVGLIALGGVEMWIWTVSSSSALLAGELCWAYWYFALRKPGPHT